MTSVTFVSGHSFGKFALQGLLKGIELHSHVELSLLVCLSPAKSEKTVGYCDLGQFFDPIGINKIYTHSIHEIDTISAIRESKPDYLFIVGWSELIGADLLSLPCKVNNGITLNCATHACIGMHPTLLPEGRGRAPIPWTIIKNLSKSGVSAFALDTSADAGPLIAQVSYPVVSNETSTTLFAKAEVAHYQLGVQIAAMIADRQLVLMPQNEEMSSYWERRRPADSRIDFARSASEIERLVRALQPPYPPPFVTDGRAILEIDGCTIEARDVDIHAPGTVIERDGNLIVVSAAGGLVHLTFRQSVPSTISPGFKFGDAS